MFVLFHVGCCQLEACGGAWPVPMVSPEFRHQTNIRTWTPFLPIFSLAILYISTSKMAYADDAVRAKLSALNETQDSIVSVAQWVMFHR